MERAVRRALDEHLRAARDRLAAAEAALRELLAARDDAGADDEHDPEGVTMSAEWSKLAGLATSARAELAALEDARERAERGAYGRCVDCGTGIPAARLEIRPAARRCVPCEQRHGG